MNSLRSGFLDSIRLAPGEASTLRELGSYHGRQDLFRHQAPEVLRDLLVAAIIESSESSNRLEGITAPRKRIAALVLKPTIPQNRSEQEIAGYRDGINLIHESFGEMAFTVKVILQLRSMLYRYQSGVGGRCRFSRG